MNDYRDWEHTAGPAVPGIETVVRDPLVQGHQLQDKIREHISMARWFEKQLAEHPEFEILAPVTLSVVLLRYKPTGSYDTEALNRINDTLMKQLNATGKLFLTHTKLNGQFTLRMSVAGTLTAQQHVAKAWELIQETATNYQGA
ncbi:MAG: hypothetical protein U0Z17_07245 [Bacteroidales bacterium]